MGRQPQEQRWTGDDEGQVRVLVECEPADSPSIVASLVERHGFSVRTCEGPRNRPCPLIEGEVCDLVAGADVVVNLLRDPVSGHDVLGAVARTRRPPGLVTETKRRPGDPPPPPEARPERPWQGNGGTVHLEAPIDGRRLVAGIREALRRNGAPPTWWGDGVG